MVEPNADEALRARGTMVGLVFGSMAAQVVAAAARLGLADLIGDGERTSAALARELDAHEQATLRLLRAMAALDLLTEREPGVFALTPAGALLRTDRPDSVDSFVRMFTDPAMLRAWEHLDHSVRTGRTAFDEVFGKDFFAHLKDDPELSARFNASMSQGTRLTAAALPGHYDFGRFRTVVDVGGGDGTLLAAILDAHPSLRGVLFDSPEGLAQAGKTLRDRGVAERCTLETGDFFAAVPPGGDLYLLKSVIHDWDEERAATILRHCREVIPDEGRLLIVEPVMPPVVDPSAPGLMYLSDLNMLVNVGGRERTRTDFATLCERAGFTLTEATPLPPQNAFHLIEAAPA
ncbi:acetylserotonin O-methyltransferase [Actinomadura kijaniata]|uniref:acetylserotonin O-methyltransferase n=1 Tax=Actinomadura kijaniata TaxID=46161 RepID=UPI000AFBED2F|nr:acetylserotonin O-methyltransferase [Actinomadura kijaniata]